LNIFHLSLSRSSARWKFIFWATS